jgi:ubiquinone/menaquinone biosynthesis C-methylase UbiE
MDEALQRESEKLTYAWMCHDQNILRDYLVQDVEDPRINLQSVLTRHYLLEQLLPPRFSEWKDSEIRFSTVMNWLLQRIKQNQRPEILQLTLYSLLEEKNIEEVTIPDFIRQTFQDLPHDWDGLQIPDYISDILTGSPAETLTAGLADYVLSTFQNLWRQLLKDQEIKSMSVVEPACGSANEFRFLHSFGIAPFLNYYGFDLCAKNIANAQSMFPGIRFDRANVLELPEPDKAFDVCIVHDLFEHLSIPAMEAASAEICRITRQGICVGFFNMFQGDRHIIQPVHDYHWNKLSCDRVRELFAPYAQSIQTIHHDSYLTDRFGYHDTHNKNAYLFIITL